MTAILNAGFLKQNRMMANKVAYSAWCLVFFFLPFSTALGLTFSGIALIGGLIGFSKQNFYETFRDPVIMLCVGLLAWLSISIVWSIAPQEELLEAWSKYRKLIYPILIVLCIRHIGKSPAGLLQSFIAGCGLVALMSISSSVGLVEYVMGKPSVAGGWYIGPGWLFIGGPENPTFGRNHITQGAFLSFAAMLTLGYAWCAWRKGHPMAKTAGWLLGALTMLYPIFQMQGRTGYLLVGLLILFWFAVLVRYLTPKRAVVIILITFLPIFIIALQSHQIQNRIKVMSDSISSYVTKGELTDSGVRLEFWVSGLKILYDRPVLGAGLGGYAQAYSELPERSSWLRNNRSQPHSEYILIATQGGGIGLVIFVMLVLNTLAAAKSTVLENPGTLGLAILFFIDGLFNSVIWDFAEGHFFSLVVIASIYKNVLIRNSGQA